MGWDSVRVTFEFRWQAAIGKDNVFPPDTLSVILFDENYRTLYAGTERMLPIPDWSLGDRERLLVEVCGGVRGRQICKQEILNASPKRIGLAHDIQYPGNNDYTRGRYRFDFEVERQQYGSDTWERSSRSTDVGGYLLSWIGEQPEETIKIPFSTTSGSFNLTRLDNYKAFRYNLESQLYDHKEALVNFDIYAGLNGHVDKVQTVEKLIQLKTPLERTMEVYFFAEQASEHLIDTIDSLRRSRRAVAYIDEWDYDNAARTYSIQMEVHWRASFFSDRTFRVNGILRVKEDGSTASFLWQSGNSESRRRWRSRVGNDVLDIGTLTTLEDRDTFYGRLPQARW